MATLVSIGRKLGKAVDALSFASPVEFVYNPLAYARQPHEQYLGRYGGGKKEVLFLGMNPGPFGMAQTGVPFGDVAMVRDWLGIEGQVASPKRVHEKRPITGFACPRGEVSGQRFWGWARERFKTPEAFFAGAFVTNYCPLIFLEAGGRNRTPDKLPSSEREPLFEACDEALRNTVDVLRPKWVLGIGKFAEGRARAGLEAGHFKAKEVPKIASILHPSPASPAANKGWAPQVDKQIEALGVRFFLTERVGSDLTKG